MKNKKHILCGAFAVLALSLAGGSLAFNANVDESTKTLDGISIDMVKGASMRIGSAEEGNAETSTGLRFTMQVTKAEYEAVDKSQYSSIEWGMLIAPVEYVAEAPLEKDYVFGENAVYYAPESESEAIPAGKKALIKVSETALTLASDANLKIENAENYYVFSGYMHSIKAENLTRGFVGRGYVKYTVGDNEPQYIFANYAEDNAENNTRSAYYVAQQYVNANKDTETATYVQTNYLNNATALKTAEVEVAAQDYMEDITIGTYAATPDNNTVTLKIGEAYDAANEEMNKKDGYKLVSTSGTATPLYRGQKLSIKRYYESNDYIPFSNTEGAVSVATAEDGEEVAGAYKFAGTRIEIASKKNYKVIQGVTVPEDSKVHLVNYVTMKAYFTTYGAFNLVSQLGDAATGGDGKDVKDWAVSVDWYETSAGGNDNGYKFNGTRVAYYDENGYRTFNISTNTWYTVSFPVYTNYHDQARFGNMYWTLPANNTLYFKDVKIENVAVDPNDVSAAYSDLKTKIDSTATTETVVTEGAFAGSKKLETTSNDWHTGLWLAGESNAATWAMLIKGAKYLSLNVYFTGATTDVGFYDNVAKKDGSVIDNSATLGEALPSYNYTYTYNNGNVWGKWGGFNPGQGKTLEIVRFYDEDGNKVNSLQKDTWYTAIIMLTTNEAGSWGSMRLKPMGGSAENPAIMYYNNLRYSCANPKA